MALQREIVEEAADLRVEKACHPVRPGAAKCEPLAQLVMALQQACKPVA
jgi:hypothetical protein